MGTKYFFAENILIAESFFIALIVLLTYLSKSYYVLKNTITQKIRLKIQIENFLKSATLKPHNFNLSIFPKNWQRLDLLIEVTQETDSTNTFNEWTKIRAGFIKKIIFPLARNMAIRRNWISRLYAARAFCLLKGGANEEYIIKLTNDKIPLVFLYAARAAVIHDSEKAIFSIIKKMASESWTEQSIFLQAFDDFTNQTYSIIEKILATEMSPNIRSTCYEILCEHVSGPIKWDMTQDLTSKNSRLKIAALKFYAKPEPDSAIPVLIANLKDPEVEVRLIALHRLQMLKAKQAISEITVCLDDSDWWVRISACEALKSLGKEGADAIAAHKPELEKVDFNFTHLKNTWW